MDKIFVLLRRLRFLIHKEILATIKDPRTRIILTAPVLIQSLLFGYAATYNLDQVPYACLDQSHSRASQELLQRLDGTGIFQRTASLTSTSQIASVIDTDQALLVLQIPPDFAAKLAAGQEAPLQVITDGRNTTTASVASGYVNKIVQSYNIQQRQGQNPLELQIISWYNPNLLTRWMFLPSLLPMMSLIQVMMLGGLSVAREKEQGTFDQLLVTPLSPGEILIGKAIPPVLIGLLQAFFILCVSLFWFKIKLVGSLAVLFLTLLVFLTSCVGVALSISAISNSMQQVMVYNFVLIMPMVLLSGLATPVRNMPVLLQYLTYADPLRFAIEAVRRIYLEGATLATISFNFVPMLLLAAVTLPLAAYLFRHHLSS